MHYAPVHQCRSLACMKVAKNLKDNPESYMLTNYNVLPEKSDKELEGENSFKSAQKT